jgi:surface protein
MRDSSWITTGRSRLNFLSYRSLTEWNTSSATTMSGMFAYQELFDQDISRCDVSNLIRIYRSGMRRKQQDSCRSFNQDISNWDVSNVVDMSGMFTMASTFHQKFITVEYDQDNRYVINVCTDLRI